MMSQIRYGPVLRSVSQLSRLQLNILPTNNRSTRWLAGKGCHDEATLTASPPGSPPLPPPPHLHLPPPTSSSLQPYTGHSFINPYIDHSRSIHTSNKRFLHTGESHGTQTSSQSEHTARDDVDVTISATQRLLHLTEVKGRQASFNATWLRHNCQCSGCRQPHSGQLLVSPHQLKPLYTISHAQIKGNEVHVRLEEDPDHVTIVTLDYLWDNDYSSETREAHRQATHPLTLQGPIPNLTYDEVLASPAGKLRWLENINKYGICLLKGVPTEEGKIKEVAELIWPVQRTIYGTVFDVISTPKPINVAYSPVCLDFHMDLIYYESPPGIQLLHCLRFDECVEGGENIFVDAFAVAEELRERYPEDFHNLSTIPATFQKDHFDRDHPVYMRYRKPHIQCNDKGDIIALSWAPPFEGPLSVPEEDVEPYYQSYHRFAQLLEESNSRREMKLEEGDLIAFINCRVLHARRAFTLNGGVRHLQGCYLNIDEFRSEVDVMCKTHGGGATSRRVCNHSYS